VSGNGAGIRPPAAEALLVDLDDTLVTTNHAIEKAREAAHHLLAARRPEFAGREGDVVAAFRAATDTLWPSARSGQTDDLTFQERRMTLAFQHLGLDDPALAREMIGVYLDTSYRAVSRFEEVEEILPALARSFKLALVTNGLSTIQRRKILKFGFERYFPIILVAGEFGASKPDPSIFFAAISRLGVKKEACLVVGDSIEREIKGSRAAGLSVAWINRTGAEAPEGLAPDYEYRDLSSLLLHAAS